MFHDRTLARLDRMLDEGIAGTFTESDYDESRLSRLESKWYRYLTQSAQAKENLNRERENMRSLTSDISHQTKTPMTNIRMYSELLKEHLQESGDTDGSSIAAEIVRQANKLDFLLGCLTKLSRLESGILTVEPAVQSLSPLLLDSADALKSKAAGKNISISIPEKLEVYACYDLKWTREALENILDNAIKYSSFGSRITVTVKTYELYVAVSVADEGIGISEAEIPKIFGRFYRSETVHDQEGVGIGLFLAREILRREDGYIKVKSQVQKGSEFLIYLKR